MWLYVNYIYVHTLVLSLILQCPLFTVPELKEYHWIPYQMKLGLSGRVQSKNASLALQLSQAFLNARACNAYSVPSNSLFPEPAPPFQIHLPDALGLARVFWPGRSHVLKLNKTTFYMDGAHTPESMEECVEWFLQSSSTSSSKYRIAYFFPMFSSDL